MMPRAGWTQVPYPCVHTNYLATSLILGLILCVCTGQEVSRAKF